MTTRRHLENRTVGRAGWLDSRLALSVAVLVIGICQVDCRYHPPRDLSTPAGVYRVLNGAPFVKATESKRTDVLVEAKGLKIQHGHSCAQAEIAASRDSIGMRISEFAEMPESYDGTVFLNGWHLKYRNKDHHVIGLGSAIFNIENVQIGRIHHLLRWHAGGVLSDKNGDDPYEWCYDYTLVFWPKAIHPILGGFDINVQVSDKSGKLVFVDTQTKRSSALHTIVGTFPGQIPATSNVRDHRAGLRSGIPSALPNGFAMAWDATDDNHILQVAFDLGNLAPPVNLAGWTSHTIFKDNDNKPGYYASEIVSVISGSSVNVWQPAKVLVTEGASPDAKPVEQSNVFDVFPLAKKDRPGAVLGSGSGRVYHVRVNDVPFDYAIPILSGWELHYSFEDHHVRTAGVSLRDFKTERNPNGKLTLHCTIETILQDDGGLFGGSIGSGDRLKIGVLGINRVGGIRGRIGAVGGVLAPLSTQAAPTPPPTPTPRQGG